LKEVIFAHDDVNKEMVFVSNFRAKNQPEILSTPWYLVKKLRH